MNQERGQFGHRGEGVTHYPATRATLQGAKLLAAVVVPLLQRRWEAKVVSDCPATPGVWVTSGETCLFPAVLDFRGTSMTGGKEEKEKEADKNIEGH